MKKKILAGVLVMVFVLASVMGVSAAGSKDAQASLPQESIQAGYIIRVGEKQFWDDDPVEELENKADILKYNAEELSLDSLLGDATDVKNALKGMTALTKIFDLHDENVQLSAGEKHRVTINVPALSTKCTDVKVLHYSMVDLEWEILKLEDSDIDIPNKQVTVVSDDLSPIAIFATVSTGSGTGSSPATGMGTSTWMIMAAVVLVAAGSVVVISRKKRA